MYLSSLFSSPSRYSVTRFDIWYTGELELGAYSNNFDAQPLTTDIRHNCSSHDNSVCTLKLTEPAVRLQNAPIMR